jgi:hypothetical protein
MKAGRFIIYCILVSYYYPCSFLPHLRAGRVILVPLAQKVPLAQRAHLVPKEIMVQLDFQAERYTDIHLYFSVSSVHACVKDVTSANKCDCARMREKTVMSLYEYLVF